MMPRFLLVDAAVFTPAAPSICRLLNTPVLRLMFPRTPGSRSAARRRFVLQPELVLGQEPAACFVAAAADPWGAALPCRVFVSWEGALDAQLGSVTGAACLSLLVDTAHAPRRSSGLPQYLTQGEGGERSEGVREEEVRAVVGGVCARAVVCACVRV